MTSGSRVGNFLNMTSEFISAIISQIGEWDSKHRYLNLPFIIEEVLENNACTLENVNLGEKSWNEPSIFLTRRLSISPNCLKWS